MFESGKGGGEEEGGCGLKVRGGDDITWREEKGETEFSSTGAVCRHSCGHHYLRHINESHPR